MKMRNQEHEDSNIIGYRSFRSMKKKILAVVVLTIFIMMLTSLYLPFCKFEMFQISRMYDYKAELYVKLMYFRKGRTFNAIGKNGDSISIRLGWDDCIYVKLGNEEKKLKVDKVEEILYRNFMVERHDYLDENGKHIMVSPTVIRDADPDSTYYGASFEDCHNNFIHIFKQQDNLPYGGHEYGMNVKIDSWRFSSGNNNYFDY